MANVGNSSAGKILIEILQVLLQILQRFTLGGVVGELFKITKPMTPIFPINVFSAFHTWSIST